MSSTQSSTPVWYAAPIDAEGQPQTAGITGRLSAGHAIARWQPFCDRLFVGTDADSVTIHSTGETSRPSGRFDAAFEPDAILDAIRAASAVAAEQSGWDALSDRFNAALDARDVGLAAGLINRVTRAAGIDPIGDALLAQAREVQS